MMDRFANFVIQRFLMIGDMNQRHKLFSQIQSDFMELSRNGYGSYVVRKAIERATYDQLIGIMKQCTGKNVATLAEDINGNHILQHMIRSPMVVNHPIQVIFYCKIKFLYQPLDRSSLEKLS